MRSIATVRSSMDVGSRLSACLETEFVGVTHNICFIVQLGEAGAADRLSALIVSWKTGELLFSCWIKTLHARQPLLRHWMGSGNPISPPRGVLRIIESRMKSGHACMHACTSRVYVCSGVSHTARRKSSEPQDCARPAFTTV